MNNPTRAVMSKQSGVAPIGSMPMVDAVLYAPTTETARRGKRVSPMWMLPCAPMMATEIWTLAKFLPFVAA